MDRTEQFARLTARGGQTSGGSSGHTSSRLERGGDDSHFNSRAADLGRSIDGVNASLENLRKLVRKRGIFSDHTSSIEGLTSEVKRGIDLLNSTIEGLALEVDSGRLGAGQSGTHEHHILNTLKARLLDTTKGFKDVLQMRSENMRQQDSRRQMYSTSTSSTNSEVPAYFTSASSSQMDLEGGERQTLTTATRGPTSLYHQTRADAVQNVQQMIGEIAQIFQKAATLVTQQDEMIQRIDEDVDQSMSNISKGQTHLLKYFNSISSNRALVLKVFGVIMFFITIFVLFLA